MIILSLFTKRKHLELVEVCFLFLSLCAANSLTLRLQKTELPLNHSDRAYTDGQF